MRKTALALLNTTGSNREIAADVSDKRFRRATLEDGSKERKACVDSSGAGFNGGPDDDIS